jgi:Gene product 88
LPRVPIPLSGEPDIPPYTGDMQTDLSIVSRHRLAEQITGGLSLTTKMPCPSWGIPATRCRIGAMLAQKEGTVCHHCYALKGRYTFPNVQAALERRFQGLFHELWTPAMAFLVNYYWDRYFRWFCSGDLPGENHLRNICTVARHTPGVLHWLPTREAETVRAVRQEGPFPENLVVRVSGARIDGQPPKSFPQTSTVVSQGVTCPAPDQGGHSGEGRDCWDPEVATVSYRLH